VVLPRAFLLHADRGYQLVPGLPCALSIQRAISKRKPRTRAAPREGEVMHGSAA